MRGKQKSGGDNTGRRERHGGIYRITIAVLGEKTGNRGTDKESDAKRNADHRKRFGPFFRLSDIRDIGLRQRYVPGSEAIHNSREEDQPQRIRQSEQDEAEQSAYLTKQKQRLPSCLIGKASKHRASEQLAQRVDRDKHPHTHRTGPIMLGVKR